MYDEEVLCKILFAINDEYVICDFLDLRFEICGLLCMVWCVIWSYDILCAL